MKIVLLESLGIKPEVLNSYVEPLKAKGHTFESYERDMDIEKQKERAKDADVLMIANMPLAQEVVDACDHLKFINVAFTGVDHVPVARAKERGIAVSNASGYSNESVAELVMAMTLNLLRKVQIVEANTRNGSTVDGNVGNELQGKTVGVVGTGAIGRRVAELFNCFGCNVLGYDPFPKELPNVKNVSLEELLQQSDIVTLHCPLMDSTRGLINAENIKLMKKTALLINCARGPIVDAQAVADALNNDQIAGAGMDVFEVEPPIPASNPLLNSKNTLVTPHIAFLSEESMVKRAKIVFDSLDQWMAGNQVNKIC